jgi:hypothetical protein
MNKIIHINPQSKGSLGKSLYFETLVAWLDALGIPWKGYDLDDRHRTFSDRHPEKVELVNLDLEGPNEAILQMFAEVFQDSTPVFVIDTRAQADQLLLNAFGQLRVLERAERADARIVLSLFPSDDNESLANFQQIVRHTHDQADYVVVRNPACSRGTMFQDSTMRDTILANLGGVELTVPVVTNVTIQTLEQVERRERRTISFSEFAAGIQGVDPLITGEMQFLLGSMALQFNRVAARLLPDEQLDKVPSPTIQSRTQEAPDLDLSF